MALRSSDWRALGTDVAVFVEDAAAMGAARQIVEQELEAIDLAASRFRADSDLSRINRGEGRWVEVGAPCLGAIEAGLRAARLTAGAVDPTIGRSLRAAGYDRDYSRLRRDGPRRRVTFVAAAGWRTVELDRARGAVRVPSGVQLDLGATAKALAADRAAAQVSERLACGAMVSLGGDIAVAGAPPEDGWPVRVTDDQSARFDAPGQTVAIRAGGLATSSTTARRWGSPGHELHHILDPRTGRPVPEAWRTVSVAAASCLDANIASTAAIVRGESAPRWLAGLRLPARLAAGDGRVARLAGWPTEDAA